MRTVTLISAAALIVCAGIPAALASSAYTCETFRYGSPTSFTNATGLNNKRQVVGYYTQPGGGFPQVVHAFLRDPGGTMTPLTSPAGDDNFKPLAINNSGQILGPSFILNPDGTFITIDQPQAPPGHTYLPYMLSGLNDTGEVGGSFEHDFDPSFGIGVIDFFIRGPDGNFRIIYEVGTGGSPSAFPGPINNSGYMVLGSVHDSDTALIQPDGTKITLSYPGRPAMGGAGGTIAYRLNNKNTIAGMRSASHLTFLRTDDGQYHLIVPCPDSPLANIGGLNDANVVVGPGAFLATPTGLFPNLQISNDSWTFGPQVIGNLRGYGRIYISNAGPADFPAQEIWIGPGQYTDQSQSFRITGTNCGGVAGFTLPSTMPPGEWCYLDFAFTPQAPGWQTAAIYIPDESPESPHIIPVGGTGIGSTLQLSNTSWDFGAHNVGDVTGNGVIYVYNQGPAVVTFRSTGINGSPFEFHLNGNTCGGQLAAYTTCALSFNFTPMASGERTAIINLNDNSNYGPISIPIMGWVY